MQQSSLNKYQAALIIDEDFQQSNQIQHKWLLTYLDVFILIIMLIITLIAVSDLKNEQQSAPTQILKKNGTQSTVSKQTQSTKIVIKTDDNAVSDIIEANTQTHLLSEDTKTNESPLKNQDKTAIIDFQDSNEFKDDKPKQENQLSDDSLQEQLKKTVDQLGLSDSVDMKVTLGYAQLEIQDKILFKSSKALLLTDGGALLKKLIPLLNKSSGLIYIEGHTDNRPIKTAKFPSNWELGAARATSVLHYLASENLDTHRLRAITYGETKPIADNSTKEGREANRRVSLVIKISDKID